MTTVAICGAGIAGSTLAYWLSEYGYEPTLIEKAPSPRTGGYLIDFWGGGYQIAQRMGLGGELRSAGYYVEQLRLTDRRNRTVGGFSLDPLRRALGGELVTLPRGDLASMLYHRIADRAEMLFGDSIGALEPTAAGTRVTLDSGQARTFDLVVGADGIHSRVRDLVFGPQSAFERDLGYRVLAFETDSGAWPDGSQYVAFNAPGRMVARFAMSESRTLILMVFSRSHPDPRDVSQAKTAARRIFGDAGWDCPQILQAMDRAEDVYFDRVCQIAMSSWSHDRVVLIGDAAAAVSLLAGEGAGLAMMEAYVLADELRRADGDHQLTFGRYERRLRPFVGRKQRMARRFATVFAPRTAPGLWVRNQASKLLTVPGVTEWLARQGLGDDIELPSVQLRK